MSESKAQRWQLIAAFTAIYIIWGSTYLTIAWAIQTMPPFVMAGVRFLIAGSILYVLSRLRGVPHPARIEWRSGAIVGALLLFMGNGGVTWSEQTLPSGLAALLVATVPIWVSVVNWVRPGGVRPTRGMFIGLALGLVGIMILLDILHIGWTQQGLQVAFGLEKLTSGKSIDPGGTIVILIAAMAWATGTVYSRTAHAKLPSNPLMSTATQMLSGGLLLTLAAIFTGEYGHVNLAAVSLKSVLSLAYLVVFGAIVAYSAYVWLIKNVNPSLAATYAYVNPVVAVFLGWALANEKLTSGMLIATPVIVLAVILITTQQPRPTSAPVPTLEDFAIESAPAAADYK